MQDSGISVETFYSYPFTAEGIPSGKLDPEYMLKPADEKFKTGAIHDFFEVLKAQKLLGQQLGKAPWSFDIDDVIMNPAGEAALIEIMGKPLKLLRQKIEKMTASGGKRRRLEFCYFPISTPAPKDRRKFWRDLCHQDEIPFMDLVDDFNALGTTYYPFAGPSMGHFTANGMTLFSTIMVHELLFNSKIPFKGMEP